MTRTKENSSKSPRELLHASKDTKLQGKLHISIDQPVYSNLITPIFSTAKKTALSLIEKALSAHILSSADNFNILRGSC